MPRIFGSPSAKAASLIRSRSDLNTALRTNDSKALLGYSDTDDDGFSGMLGMTSVVPGVQTNRFRGYSDYLAAGTRKIWATARCCSLKADAVVSTETKIIKRGQKISEATTIKVDPALTLLMQNPNPFDTISEMLWLWVWRMELTGNAFWVKDQMNGLGQPIALYDLNPRFMVIVPDKHLRVASYIYRVNGNEIKFDPEEIIHFRRPHANDPLWGLGAIESGESLFDDHINRTMYNTRLMANGAFPTSMLVKEDFDGTPEDWDLMTNNFGERYTGVNNTGKVAMATGKWNVLKLGMDAAAMQELEKGTSNIEQIFINHGVPLSIAGFSHRTNLATGRQDDLNFRRFAIMPIMNMYCDVMNSARGFIQSFSPDIKLDFSLSGLIDMEQVMKDNAPLFDRGGVTPNQMRELAGLPKIADPFLDQYYILNTYVPIEVAGIAPTNSPTGQNPGDNPSGEPAKPTPDAPQDNAPVKPKPGKAKDRAA